LEVQTLSGAEGGILLAGNMEVRENITRLIRVFRTCRRNTTQKRGKRAPDMSGKKGFTLIELVMVMIILGILAVVAVPKFIDMRNEAKAGTLKGLLGSLQSQTNSIKSLWIARIYEPFGPLIEKCGKPPDDGPPSNDWMKCAAKWAVPGEFPENPFTGDNTITVTNNKSLKPCDTVDPEGGWVYQVSFVSEDEFTLHWWANSSTTTLEGGGTEACVQPGG